MTAWHMALYAVAIMATVSNDYASFRARMTFIGCLWIVIDIASWLLH